MKLNVKALADVEIGYPVLAEGLYHARIEKTEVKPNKRQSGMNLLIQFKILDNPLSYHKDGKTFENKGKLVNTRYFSLEPTPDYDPDENMKMLALAIGLDPTQDLNTEDLDGKMVMVKLSYKPADKDEKTGKEYPEGNEVSRVTKVPADDAFTAPPF